MLHVDPTGWFRPDYEVHDGRQPIARIHLSWFQRGGLVELGNRQLVVERVGWRHRVQLREGERVLGSAWRRGFLPGRWEVSVSGAVFGLGRSDWFSREYRLLIGGAEAGSVRPRGLWTRALDADLPATMTREAMAFVLWVVVWRERARRRAH